MSKAMASEVQLDDLSRQKISVGQPDGSQSKTDDFKDGVISVWVWISSSLLFLLSLCLVLCPRLLLFASETSFEGRAILTPLESLLAQHFGIWLSAIAVTLILNIPSPIPISISSQRQVSQSSHPLLAPITTAGLLSSWLTYNTQNVGSLSSILCIGAGIIGLWGLWAIVFTGSSHISKKTGADKRTSTFLFGNKNAASVQKKNWKKEQRG